MPYDKGDFTQQGIDGKVSGGLLLNNKRDVDVLVTTNEDDSTLGGVAVQIEDHLNNLKYAFWGENLEAGEVYEIGAGGGGFANPKCTLTVVNNTGSEAYLAMGLNTYNDENIIYIMPNDDTAIPANTTKIVDLVSIPHVANGELEWSEYIVNSPGPVASDLVNCTFSSTLLTITDPTQDASLTLTIS